MEANIKKILEKVTTDKTTEISEALTIENCAPVSAKLDIKNGKSIQEGEPSPDNIIPIRNVGDNINKLYVPDYELTSYGVKTTTNNGKISIKGTTADTYFYLSDFIDCNIEKGDYIFSLSRKFGFQVEVSFKYSDNTRENLSFINVESKEVTFTKDVIAYRIAFSLIAKGTNIDYNITAKIEKGSTATPYTPYNAGAMNFQLSNEDNSQSRIVSFPFTAGQRLHIRDYLADDGIHQKNNTYSITGNETIVISQSHTNTTLFRITALTNYSSKSDYLQGICSHFKFSAVWGYDIEGIYTNANFIYLSINNNTIGGNTVEKLKTWLAKQYSNGTPVTIEYELAEEKIIPYIPEQEQAYYELQHLLMYEGYTSIECIDEIKPDIQLTYWYNNELNKSYGERFDKVEDSINELEKSNTYSTEERRIGTWTDGKPLYRQVLKFGALANNGETKVYYDSTFVIQKFDIYIENPNGYKMHLPIPTTNYVLTFIAETEHYIAIQTASDRTAFTNNYIILEYTKTTD